MTRSIYCLFNNGIPTYIGKTKNIKSREINHKKTYPDDVFEVIDEVPTSEWRFWERHYISLYKSWGFKLYNKKTYGGNGADIMSEETKIKLSKSISKAKKENPITNETRNKMSIKKKGRFLSEETKKKMSGKIMSDETKTKISNSNKGKIRSKEALKNMSKANLGKVMSEESKEKMSKAKIGKPSSFKGKKQSDEAKEKMSKAKKGRIPWNKGLKIKKK